MSNFNYWRRESSPEHVISDTRDFREVANDLCERALEDAKSQLHPLLQKTELGRLSQRSEFLQAFQSALEQRIARKLAIWQPAVQAVFRFDETKTENMEYWDGSIHLLVKVPRLSNAMMAWGKKMDQSLVKYFKQLGWSRFRKRESILDVQQVTPNELRHGIGYGAMFFAVHTVPVRVWPQNQRAM